MTERVEVNQLFNLRGKAQQSGVHDIGQEPGQGLHIIAGFNRGVGRHPFIFRGLDQIINLGVDHLENPLLGRFLITPELLRSSENDRGASGILRPRRRQEQFELTAG